MAPNFQFVFTNHSVHMAGVRSLNALAVDDHGIRPRRGLRAAELAKAASALRLAPNADGYRFAPYHATRDRLGKVLHLRLSHWSDLVSLPAALQVFRGWQCTVIEPSVLEPDAAADLLFHTINGRGLSSYAWLTVADRCLLEPAVTIAKSGRERVPHLTMRLSDAHIDPDDRLAVRKLVAFAEALLINTRRALEEHSGQPRGEESE